MVLKLGFLWSCLDGCHFWVWAGSFPELTLLFLVREALLSSLLNIGVLWKLLGKNIAISKIIWKLLINYEINKPFEPDSLEN